MSGGLLGGAVGAVAGFFIPGVGPMLGYAIGSSIGSYIDPPKGPHMEGPRLSDLSVQTSTYGAVIPRGYGTFPVVGNVFWLENNALKEVATTTTSSSGGKGGGGSESTTTTYSYYATFAVGLCEGPIVGVRRIWVGAELIYDAGATALDQLTASAEASALFTVHYGTDTQLADDRMQATLGVSDTPAYRGLAYLVLLDYPLAKHGNSLAGAQVKAEVVTAGTVSPISFVASGIGFDYTIATQGYLLDPHGYFWARVTSGSQLLRIHAPTGTVSGRRPYVASNGQVIFPYGFNQAGTLLGEANGGQMLMIRPSGEEVLCPAAVGIRQYAFGTSEEIWAVPWSGLRIYSGATGMVTANCPASGTFLPARAGTVIGKWVHFQWDDGLSTNWMTRFDPVANIFQLLFAIPSGYGGSESGITAARVVCGSDGYFYAYDSANDTVAKFSAAGALVATASSGLGVPIMYHGSGKLVCRSTTSPTRYRVLRTATLEALAGYCEVTGAETRDAFNCGTMAVNQAISVLVDTVPAGTQALSAIVSAECFGSNLLASGDIDVTALTQAVRGYRIGSVASIRSALEPLQGAWPFDVVQHGYQIKFVPRGGSSIASVPAADLDARAAGQAPGVAVTVVREMDSVLPARVLLKFLDVDREYNDNEQYAERLNTAAINVRSLDMAIALTATEAAQIAERLLYLYWLERYDVSVKLPPTYNQVEPADVITVAATEGTYALRLARVTYTADGRLECDAKYHSAATYAPTAIGEAGQSTGRPVVYVGDSSFELLDIPLLLDAFDVAGFPAAMSGYTSGWPGGALYSTSDEGQTWTPVQGFTAPGGVIGLASAAIGAGRTDLIDKSSVLTVSLRSGSLASVTEAAMLNGANHFAYGAHGRWEIIAAQNCVLQGDGTYVLTDLLRGRFGTEWARGAHGANDTIVALDSSRLAFIATSLNAIGSARTYRGVTSGKLLSSAPDVGFTYAGVNLECLSPVYLNGSRHPSTNDWSLDWIRRTRVGGEWRDYVDALLSEASQAYEVDIFSSNTYATLKRTLTGLTTPAATYTSAQQVADFGSNQGTLYVKVYQLSANVGRGYPLTTSITR